MLKRSVCLALLGLAVCSAPCMAQVYSARVVLSGLERPRGIAVNAAGDLYFTEVPTPGLSGAMGGTNRVNLVAGGSGLRSIVEMGAPEPLHLAMNANQVFWTCRSAGVVFARSQGVNSVYRTGLMRPTGIFAMDNGEVYVTQVPTPGVSGANGGRNNVIVLAGGQTTTVSSGEPEPADVVVDAAGNGYWTCATAGVILRLDAITGARTVVVRGLEQPTGLAIDAAGALYFTELPTPGISARNGGRNKVWRLDPVALQFTLVDFGDPEPFDVAVTPDGRAVYWTCSSAGVIVRADRVGPAPTVTAFGTGQIGTTLRFFLDARMHPGQTYVAASSMSLGAIPIDSRFVALAQDALFATTLTIQGSATFIGYAGLLDANGMATVHLALPNDLALRNMAVYTAFVVIDPLSPSAIGAISSTQRSLVL